MEAYWRNFTHRPRIKQGYSFLGRVDETLSPLTEAIGTEEMIGTMIYEQPLVDQRTAINAEAKRTASAGPLRWTAMLVDPAAQQQIAPYYYNPNANQPASNVWFHIDDTNIQIVPNRPIHEDLDRSLTVGMRVDAHPNADQTHRDGNQYYKVHGCPIEIYNRRSEAWEETGIYPEGRHTIAPIGDYLHPATSALLVRVRAQPDLIHYQAALKKEQVDQAPVKTGKELWGHQEPFRQGYYRGHARIQQLQLLDVEIKLESISPLRTNIHSRME